MTNASFHTSTVLSMLGSLDPYWESQLLMEYSKDLFTCKVLDRKEMDGKYKVVDGIIYVHDQIYLTKDSKLKNKLLDTTYEVLFSNPTSFIKTYHAILDGFMWENFKEEMHSHMSKCMNHLLVEEEHIFWEELSLPPPYSLSVRGGSSMSYLADFKQVYDENCIAKPHDVSIIYLHFLNTHVQVLAPRGGTFLMGFMSHFGP